MRRSDKKKYNSIQPISDYSEILDSILDNSASTTVLLAKIEGKVLDDEKSSLAESVSSCCCIGKDDLAKEIAKKIDPKTFKTDEQHYTFLWSVANYRAVETFEYLIDAGFKGSALADNEQKGDVFYQILLQAADKTSPDINKADIRMIKKLLQTGTIYGYTDETLREKALTDLRDINFSLRSLNRLPVRDPILKLQKGNTSEEPKTPDSPLAISTKRKTEEAFGKALITKEGNQEGKGGSDRYCSMM